MVLQKGHYLLPGIFGLVVWAGDETERPRYDLAKDKVLYCVGYAHLDTQWRWDFRTTIDRFVRDTLEQNFDRFEKFPGYVFNFTGTVRYEMMKEYYPDSYERLKKYVAEGRWCVSGSSVDEGDVNVPSAEAILRHVLYGNEFFRREFGKESVDFMLPDCFGFPASLPSIWAHCGLKGFSTQKLTWGSAVGIPFKVGVWEGLDGQSVVAALDPGPYVGAIQGPVHSNPEWNQRIEENGRRYGVWADYHYYGVGDTGGAPREEDIANYLASAALPEAPFRVLLAASDQMFKDLTAEQRARLPRYRGDLLLTEHSAGTLTSQAFMKRCNRKGEQLADAAERIAVAAHTLGGAAYPREKLYRSWVRLLANQMHDILPGTSIPRAYRYSWNDELVALNGFAAVLEDSVGCVSRALDTQVEGTPLIVYNALACDRQDVVEAEIPYSERPPTAVRVYNAGGEEVPSQITARNEKSLNLLILAAVPPLSVTVFDIRPTSAPANDGAALRVALGALENEHYHVKIDERGDVSGITDKSVGRELLAAPAGLVFTKEKPRQWPAWNMDWADRQRPPLDRVSGPAEVRIAESGPVRVSVEVKRSARNSQIVQRIRLSAGDAGRRVEFDTDIDWQSAECALRAAFPLDVANSHATYNWGIGTIERRNNEPTKYEVPSHQWFDLTDRSGEYGVSILEDCKYGSDKPADDVLRLTLLFTPGVRKGYKDQHSQDWGRHRMLYALYGHRGDWRDGRSEGQARRLNQPLRGFVASKHPGALGRSYSFFSVNTPQADLRAIKLAERDDSVIVRVQELWGRPAEGVTVRCGLPIQSAAEVDGQERPIGSAAIRDGQLVFDLAPYRPRTFSVKLKECTVKLAPPRCRPVTMPWNEDVVSFDADRADGRFDDDGRTIPGEPLPARITNDGIAFELGPTALGSKNAVACRGQVLELPSGSFNRLYLLAAATQDVRETIRIDGAAQDWDVQSWTGFVGQFDDRVWERECGEVDFVCDGPVVGFATGYLKRDPVAWFCTHRHHPTAGNEAYQFSYLYQYALPLSANARKVQLPDDPRIKILAATVAENENDAVRPAAPLYDDFARRQALELRHVYPPPPVPVFEGCEPAGVVAMHRAEAFGGLPLGPPVNTDFADQAAGKGVVFRYFDGDGEYSPHPRAGSAEGTLPRLNDGEYARNDDDTQRCVWYDNQGRFFVDLGRSGRLRSIQTYSSHRANRVLQFFSLWASNAESAPPMDFSSGAGTAWTLLGVVNTTALAEGGVHGSAVTAAEGELGPYRHLLWIAEDVGQGTFFTEVDIHVSD